MYVYIYIYTYINIYIHIYIYKEAREKQRNIAHTRERTEEKGKGGEVHTAGGDVKGNIGQTRMVRKNRREKGRRK